MACNQFTSGRTKAALDPAQVGEYALEPGEEINDSVLAHIPLTEDRWFNRVTLLREIWMNLYCVDEAKRLDPEPNLRVRRPSQS